MKLEGKRILVTGGAGFIGSHLVEELAPTNGVTVLDDFSVGSEANLAAVRSRVRILRGDVTDPASVSAAVADAQVVFHLAVVCLRTSIPDPMRSHLVNDQGTLNLLLAVREAPVERFVYISSSEVYGTTVQNPMTEEHPLRPTTPYGASKLAGEAYALSFFQTYGTPALVVRPFNTYGPRAHLEGASGEVIPKFVARALAGRPLVIFGDGEQTRDYTWVKDTVRGIRLAAECDALVGDCINIARGEDVSINRLALTVQELLGRRLEIEHVPGRPGDIRRQHAGVDRARALLSFRAPVGIEEGLARYVEWVRTLPGDPVQWLAAEEVINWKPQPLRV
jgi:UDP-glucose 4-epimerase